MDDLDLGAVYRAHEPERREQPPYHPARMVKLLLYGYGTGVRSSWKTERPIATWRVGSLIHPGPLSVSLTLL